MVCFVAHFLMNDYPAGLNMGVRLIVWIIIQLYLFVKM